MGHKVKQSLMSSRIDFFYYAFRNVLLVSIPLFVISAFILGFSVSRSSATNSGSDSITLTLSTSCTLSSSVITPHNASLNGGQYEEGIGNTRINTYCNDNNGYSIYAIGTSNNIDGNTDLVSDLDEHYNIHTGAYANGDNIDTSTPSFWGMKLTPGVGTGSSSELTPPTIMNSYNSYNVVPSSYTLVASRTSGTNMTIDTDITGSYFNTTYNIYASSVQPAGSYEGKVKYLMVHPSSNNTRLGFNEAYASQGKIPINTESGTYYAMQDMNSDICNSVGSYDEPSQTQLIDIRDNKLYWVAKLQDGHCWMTQNLDFDISANATPNSQTTDLNVAYNPTTEQYAEYSDGYTESNGVIYYTPASSATTINFQNNGPISGWQNSNTVPYSANKTDSTETGHASLGNYYNWAAAIASNNSSSLTQDTLSDISKNPKNSICPKGWRLPTISNQSGSTPGSTNEFGRLNYLYNNNSTSSRAGLINAPLWLTTANYINATSLTGGNGGGYWSSTSGISSIGCAYYFNLNNGAEPSYCDGLGVSGYKRRGFTIRCVAE